MKTISIGKYRKLKQSTSKYNVFSILALDHRRNLRYSINPSNPEKVTNSEMAHFKQEVVQYLATASTAVLLDPEVGIAPCTATGDLPGSTGLIAALEATGYIGPPTERKSQILDGWSTSKAQRFGVSGIKLLVYFHPKSKSASQIKELVQQVAEQCKELELPLFLEPLSYNYMDNGKKLASNERYEVILETARQLTLYEVDILKAEFPVDSSIDKEESDWAGACAALTTVSKVPWVLLSASVDYDTYIRQLTIACQQGASGAAVGRAVWKEATKLQVSERQYFLKNIGYQRMEKVSLLCNALANPWTNYYKAPDIKSNWHLDY